MIILNLLLRYYKGQFSRIWIFSPSIKLDPQYAPLRKLLEKMTDQHKEPTIFEDLDQKVLGNLLDEQRLIVEQCRKRKMTAPRHSGRSGGQGRYSAEEAGRHSGRQLARDSGNSRQAHQLHLGHKQPVPESRGHCDSQEREIDVYLEAAKL